jgi:hypothetical protein
MKPSDKIFIGAFILISAAFISNKVAERMSFSERKKIEFEPGLTEKAVNPFKIMVIDTKLEPHSDLIIAKGDRFAIASDHNFWDAVDFSQRGDTIFIYQSKNKIGKLDDPTNRDINNYAQIRVLCPGGLAAVFSDIGVEMEDISLDSMRISVIPNDGSANFVRDKCQVSINNCQSKLLQITAKSNVNIDLDEKTQLEYLSLMLRDSSAATVHSFVGQQISVDCAPKASLNLSGANILKLKK